MHEGAVIEDDDVVQNGYLVPGSAESEYPTFEIVVSPGLVGGEIGAARDDRTSTIAKGHRVWHDHEPRTGSATVPAGRCLRR